MLDIPANSLRLLRSSRGWALFFAVLIVLPAFIDVAFSATDKALDPPLKVAKSAAIAGRSVASVLKDLSARNRQFIYSSQLLPNSVRVLQEPATSDALEVAREILKPHRLMLAPVTQGLYAVVPMQDQEMAASIVGRIVDVRDGEPIDNVQLRLMPGNRTTTTDNNGDFAFKDLSAERYRLHVSRPGFEPREFTLAANMGGPLDIRLNQSRYVLEGTLVTASRYPFGVKTEENSLSLMGGPLSSLSSLGEDPIRALARLPGVTQNGMTGALNIRGGATNEVLILLDDLPLRQAFHMPGYRSLLSMFDPSLVSEVNIYTGAMPARYGGRMSGVLDITSIDTLTDPRRSFGLGFLSGRARVGEALGERGDAMIAARYGTFGYLSDVIEPATGHPTYSDVFNRAHLRIGDSTDVSINALLARDALNIHRDGLNENGQLDSEAAYVWLRGLQRLDNGGNLSMTFGRTFLQQSRIGNLVSPQLAAGELAENRQSEIWDLRMRADIALTPQHSLELGGEWSHGSADYIYDKQLQFAPIVVQRFPLLGLRAQNRRLQPTREESALFLSERWVMSSRFTGQFGLRLLHVTAADGDSRTASDPRAALAYTVSGTSELRLAWGRVHQFVDVTEIAVEDAFAANPAPQQTDYFVLGYEHRIRATMTMRLETYYKDQSNVLPRFQNFVNSASILPELSFDRIFVAPRSAQVRGAELYVQESGDPWSWRLAYSWSEAQENVGVFEVPRDWDQRNVATVGLQWMREPWQLNAAAIYRSGRPTTRLTNAPGGGVIVGPRNADRLDSYWGIDFRGAWRKKMNRGIFSAAIQLTNALNHRNECCSALAAQTDASGQPSLAVTTGKTSPLVPWAGIAWDF